MGKSVVGKKEPKRASGSGSMVERSPGVWRLRVFVGYDPVSGNPRQASKTIHTKKRGGKTEAQRELNAFLKEKQDGNVVGTSATFKKLLEDWLAGLERKGLARTTIDSYRQNVKRHIIPALGHVQLDKMTAHNLDRFYAKLQDEGLSVGTVRLIHSIISGSLKQGVKWGWLGLNPASAASPPRERKKQAATISSEELRRLVGAAEEEDVDMAVLLSVAALTGARRGELCGLKWSDVDWKQRTLRIERALIAGVGGQFEGSTKTEENRTVALGKVGVDILREYRVILKERMGSEPEGWLLSYDGGETPMRAKTVTAYVTALGKRLDPPLTVHLHQTRHYAATQLLGAGVDVRTIADRLGHSNPRTTVDVYSHALADRDRRAADILGRTLRPPKKKELKA
jgi:integrase